MLVARRPLALVAVVAMAVAGCAVEDASRLPTTASSAASTRPAAGPDPTSESPTSDEPAAATNRPVVVFDEMPPLHPSVDDWDEGTVAVVAGDDTVHHVTVRLATTSEQRSHGLMEVPALPDGAGMWFVYGVERTGGFWMKNTLVPLDITFVGADERIVSVAHAVPCESDPCPVYDPAGPYHNVLEVPAGYLERIGAGVGDVVRLVEP